MRLKILVTKPIFFFPDKVDLNQKVGELLNWQERFYTETSQLKFQPELPFPHHPSVVRAAAEAQGINLLHTVFIREVLNIAKPPSHAILSSLYILSTIRVVATEIPLELHLCHQESTEWHSLQWANIKWEIKLASAYKHTHITMKLISICYSA